MKHWRIVLNEIKRHTQENPVKSKQIENKWFLSGTQVRETIHYLRVHKNEPICSDAKGYFYARNKQECQHTIAQLRSRIIKLTQVARAMENMFVEDGQEVMF
jgi:hypothetical protein